MGEEVTLHTSQAGSFLAPSLIGKLEMDGQLLTKFCYGERNNKLGLICHHWTKIRPYNCVPIPNTHSLSPLLLGRLCSKHNKLSLQVH